MQLFESRMTLGQSMPSAGGGRELHQQQQSISSPAKSRMDPAEAQLPR
jgi:hypothetical protein